VLLLAHTGIGSAVNALWDRLVTHCAGSVEPGASRPFNTFCPHGPCLEGTGRRGSLNHSAQLCRNFALRERLALDENPDEEETNKIPQIDFNLDSGAGERFVLLLLVCRHWVNFIAIVPPNVLEILLQTSHRAPSQSFSVHLCVTGMATSLRQV